MSTIHNFFDHINKNDDISTWIRFPVLFSTAVIFQGLIYMDNSERILKLTFTIGGTFALSRIFSKNNDGIVKFAVLSHLLNFLFNGQPWALLKKFDLIETSNETFDYWGRKLKKTGQKHSSIAAVAIYGSQVRGERSPTSDLDVRVISYPGFKNGLAASIVVASLRARAALSMFPLDIYVLDDTDSLDRLREDEDPQVLVDKENWLNSE
ncbi:nucleotidyltransferase domain-containing protein [Haloarcula onubensis]|uniref:Nucleotidyltransferase domain-containing protein n=1 Tax=Haloarcula onubensis TaxID=2950539 RepID=A0ABU2FJ52_9EURY|nr:nucleotidyltransferase domain-containing protein [Halomicroarcula sp. S3CR25-11]MDS0280783.1 nucleotidyltransferase domain-containing protein [Halomicroarcula sp. S3CR25-11]